jgi:hypothetical protein
MHHDDRELQTEQTIVRLPARTFILTGGRAVVAQIIDALGIKKIMFDAADPERHGLGQDKRAAEVRRAVPKPNQ